MNPGKTFSNARDALVAPRPSAVVIPLEHASARRVRREVSSETEALGQILLFTGVRYERMSDAPAEAAIPQRKRS